MRKLDTVIKKNESHRLKMQRDIIVVTPHDSIYNQYKIVKIYDICNFTFLQFYTGIDTAVQNNDNEILLHFKPVRLIFFLITLSSFLKFCYLLVT
jgi:hypothetical protein